MSEDNEEGIIPENQINFPEPKEVIITEEVKKIYNNFKIDVVDFEYNLKQVFACLRFEDGHLKNLILWEGDDFLLEPITQEKINARILELL